LRSASNPPAVTLLGVLSERRFTRVDDEEEGRLPLLLQFLVELNLAKVGVGLVGFAVKGVKNKAAARVKGLRALGLRFYRVNYASGAG